MNLAARQLGIERAQLALEKVYPGSISIAGQSYVCAAMPKPTGVDTDPLGGGWREVLPLLIRVRKALFQADGVVLKERETNVAYLGQNYRLVTIGGRQEADCAWHLTLASPAKG